MGLNTRTDIAAIHSNKTNGHSLKFGMPTTWSYVDVPGSAFCKVACYILHPLPAANMFQKEDEVTLTSPSWPLPDHSGSIYRRSILGEPPQHGHSQRVEDHSTKRCETVKSSVADAIPKSYLVIRSEHRSHRIPSLISRFSAMDEASYERSTVSLDLSRRPTQAKKVRDSEVVGFWSTARLRGGADQRRAGLFGWLKREQGVGQKLDKGKGKQNTTVVTYDGKVIGSPQPTSVLNVLPPVSRFVRQPEDRPSYNTVLKSPLNNGYDANGNHLPTLPWQDRNAPERAISPLLPLPWIPLAATSRPVTTNPFAGIYGNPNVVRSGPASPPIDCTAAGSLVDRPSALDGSQTGYSYMPALLRKNPLRNSGEAAADNADSQVSRGEPTVRKVTVNREWDRLPALPPREGVPELPLKDGDTEEVEGEDETFDTARVLSSLRPERLSLYHIKPSERPVKGFAGVDYDPASINPRPAPTTVSDARKLAQGVTHTAPDNHSICSREWDLQSCLTDDLGVDNLLKRQEQLAQRTTRSQLPQEQQTQTNIRNNNEPLNGLPEEDAPSPESAFYAKLIDVVSNYHEQKRMVDRAFEAGEITEELWKREVWRYGAAMDRTVRAAAGMTEYKILTDEDEIREAIKQPTGYAVYSSLLSTRDQEKWQRIFKPDSIHPHLPQPVNIPQQHTAMPENSLMWLTRKAGRAIRFMLAVPDDPNLKTYSSRHPPSIDIMTYQSHVGVLGPNIPSRQQNAGQENVSELLPISIRQNFAHSRTPEPQPRPSTQIAVPTTTWSDPTKINGNTTHTGVTLASSLNGRYVRAPRSRGYEQNTFVTVLNPSVVSSAVDDKVPGYGAGKRGKRQKVSDEESKITAWPEADR